MTARSHRIGVLAPALVAAGLIELLRAEQWDAFSWDELANRPAALVAWSRDDDPMAFARAIAARAQCPVVVISHAVRSLPVQLVPSGGPAVQFIDAHVAPRVLCEHVRRAVADGVDRSRDKIAR